MSFTEIRKGRQLTQQNLAKRLGVGQSTVAMWENGKSVPSMKNLLKLSNILEVSVSDLCASFKKNSA